ncbi:expressed protein [Chlorella variabilis]|uniref:Expressed protein n=1 Tax=Chlorella variabilis TaxID=554065 RepID=E1ZHT1_CHLVA|nr:expressed protein [Chlorella variabilis]EFN54658.1 expressed protein [Chlorella variabilis]|eukprot:XP_005846760.1 expressed protein [Chlorella variabilis]
MASAVSSSVATRPAAFASQQQRRAARGSRRLQRCLAAADNEEQKLDFTSNKRAALGFTESDSAGQTNVFAVEPKVYVAGSTADTTSAGNQATIFIAGVAALAAAAAVVGGLLANTGPSALDALVPAEDVKTLTAYSKLFAAELAPAPALSE